MQIKIIDNEIIQTLSVTYFNGNLDDSISIELSYKGKNKYLLMKELIDMIDEITKLKATD